ncbi:uncharacterized protein JCM10292_001278 [Rhodotorula paludigena]|uniref:uncharacterized protein n=1 Tax=Rhodotorula paludigena TaxID=86838 RepID=UPI00316F3BD1
MALPNSIVDGVVHGWFQHPGEALLVRHDADSDAPYMRPQSKLSRKERQIAAITANDSLGHMRGHRASTAALGIHLTPRAVNWPDTLPLGSVLERLEFLHRFHEAALAAPGRMTDQGPDPWAVNDVIVVEAFATLVRQEGFSHAEADIKHLATYLESAFPVAFALWSAIFRIYRHIRVVSISIRPNKSIGWDYFRGAHPDSAPRQVEPVFSRIESMPLRQPISLQPFNTTPPLGPLPSLAHTPQARRPHERLPWFDIFAQ